MGIALASREWVDKTKQRTQEFSRRLAINIATSLVNKSPVDTGLFRANWQIGTGGNVPVGVLNTRDPDGGDTIARLTSVAGALKYNTRFTFVNNLPYAQALEYGWSDQAPQGMIRLTKLEFPRLVQKSWAEAKRTVK